MILVPLASCETWALAEELRGLLVRMAPSSAFSEETRPGATLGSVRAGPTGGASFPASLR